MSVVSHLYLFLALCAVAYVYLRRKTVGDDMASLALVAVAVPGLAIVTALARSPAGGGPVQWAGLALAAIGAVAVAVYVVASRCAAGPFERTTQAGVPYRSGERLLRNASLSGAQLSMAYAAVSAPDGYAFTLRPETAFDRLFKLLGLTQELQVRRSEFDDALYVVSDDPVLRRALILNRELQADVLALFDAAQRQRCALPAVHCKRGSLWLSYTLSGDEDDVERRGANLEPEAARLLDRIAQRLEVAAAKARPRDTSDRRVALLLALASAYAFAGLIAMAANSADGTRMLHATALWRDGVQFGAGIGLVLLLAAFTLLRGTSRLPGTLLPLLALLTVGAMSLAPAVLYRANLEYDRQPAAARHLRIADKYAMASRRSGGPRYGLVVRDGASGEALRDLNVSRYTWMRLPRGAILIAQIRPGFFGYPWIAGIADEQGRPLW
ncbi:MAG TPA: hypothetical protein VIT92_14235 [Burkholderiaceae bacterium]